MMNFINLIDLYGFSMFDNIVFPSQLDKTTLIDTILDKCALYIPLYTDIKLLTQKITNFFNKYHNTFMRLYLAYMAEYNMINNYDRTETYTSFHNQTTTNNQNESATSKQTQNSNETAIYSSETNQSGNNSSLVSPDDSLNFVNDTRLETSDHSTLSSDNNVEADVTNNSNSSSISNKDGKLKEDTTHTLHAYGNIGVTTSQQMLLSELDIRPKLNIYEIIANLFFKEFMLYTY